MCVGFCGFLLEGLVTSARAGTSYFVNPAYLPHQHPYRCSCKRGPSSPLSATASKLDPHEPFARRQHPSDGPGERCQKCQNIRSLQTTSSTMEVLTTFCSTIFAPPAMTAPPASISRTYVSGPLLVD
jgi:hypothetical protein